MIDRTIGRNLHIYAEKEPNTILGGLYITNGMTNKSLYSMVDIILVFTKEYTLRHQSGPTIERDDNPLQEGSYFVVTSGILNVNDEQVVAPMESIAAGTHCHEFRFGVRARDRGCVISGAAMNEFDLARGYWGGYQAAHIFPVKHEWHWKDKNYGRWISSSMLPASGESINSIQNGLLLKPDIHSYFDDYLVSINPDDNYKIIFFKHDDQGIAGAHCGDRLRPPPCHRPAAQLLRWHYRQAVLLNVRGGE